MYRNMVTSLLELERIETTDAKAKEIRRLADRMITLGKRGDLHARRQALAVIFTRFSASSRGRTIRGRARSSAPSLLPRNAVLLFQRRLRFAVHRAPVLPELRGRALVFLQGAREHGRDRPPQEEERQALRDPAGVHHARPRVSLVPRVRGSGG